MLQLLISASVTGSHIRRHCKLFQMVGGAEPPDVFNESLLHLKQEAFEKCWAHSLLRAAVTLPVTRCR